MADQSPLYAVVRTTITPGLAPKVDVYPDGGSSLEMSQTGGTVDNGDGSWTLYVYLNSDPFVVQKFLLSNVSTPIYEESPVHTVYAGGYPSVPVFPADGIEVNYTWLPCTPPANDDWASATVLVGASGSISGTTTCASAETDEPVDPFWQGVPTRSVWYRWTAPATGRYTFDSGPPDLGGHIELEVFIGDSLATLMSIAYNNRAVIDQSPEFSPDWDRVIIGAEEGRTYYIRASAIFGYEQDFTLHWHPTPARAVDPFVASPASLRIYGWESSDSDGAGRVAVCELRPNDLDWRVVGHIFSDAGDAFALYGEVAFDSNQNRFVGFWSGFGPPTGKAVWDGPAAAHVYPDPEDISRIPTTVLFTSADLGVPGTAYPYVSHPTFTASNRISYVASTVVGGQTEWWVVDRDATTAAVVSSQKINVPSLETNASLQFAPSSDAVVFALGGYPVIGPSNNILTATDQWEVTGNVGNWTAMSGGTSVAWAYRELRINIPFGATTAVVDLPAAYPVEDNHLAYGYLSVWSVVGGTASVQMLGPSGPIGVATVQPIYVSIVNEMVAAAAVNGLAGVGMRVTIELDAPAGLFTSVSLYGAPTLQLVPPVALYRMNRVSGVVTTVSNNLGAAHPQWGDPSFSVKQIAHRPNGQLAVHTETRFFSGESVLGFHWPAAHFSVLNADGSVAREYRHPPNDRKLYFGSYDPNLDGWIVSYYGASGAPYTGIDNAFAKAGMGFIDAETCIHYELPPVPQVTYDTWEVDVFAASASPPPPRPPTPELPPPLTVLGMITKVRN